MPDGSFAPSPPAAPATPVSASGARLAPADLRRPEVAWPTVALLIACYSAWALAAWGAAAETLSPLVVVALATWAAYSAFTPAHDASHLSVGRSRALNGLVGRLATAPLFGPFVALRAAHLAHHRHVNEGPDDPDHYAGRGPAWQLPLRWLTQDLSYYGWIIRQRGRLPRRDLAETVLVVALQLIVVALLVWAGEGRAVLLAWLIPSRLALAALACTFDWLPHRPHTVPAREDRYRASHITTGPGFTALMWFQNYHLVHHIYPGIPFYRYRRVWRRQREAWLARGARVQRVFGWRD
jgi:fatty acid desaturase